MHQTTRLLPAALLLSAAALLPAAPASAGADVFYPDECGWTPEPPAFPGLEETIIADHCMVVLTPSGTVHCVLRGELPDDLVYSRAVSLKEPGESGNTIATPSGNILATCG